MKSVTKIKSKVKIILIKIFLFVIVKALRGVRDNHEIRQAILDTLPVIFDAVDTNGDGQIANDEFKAYFESLGINNEKFTNDVFKEMDTNNDRMLSKDGFFIYFCWFL